MHGLLREIGDGADWRPAAAAQFGGQGSFGNGAAMRVAPLGAYFADDLDLLVDQATRSAEVTHTHHEGIAGAVAVAVAAGLAWHAGRTGSRLEPDDFLELVAERVPASEVRDGIRRARRLGVGCPIRQLVASL
jgi:ADP-ribosylglycohydrolase